MKNLKYAFILLAIAPSMIMNAEEMKTKGGVNPANVDLSVAPGADFYDYACGGWMKANPIGDEYSRYGTFDALGENNRNQLKQLFVDLTKQKHEAGSVGQKVSDLYLLGLDSIRLNKEGALPLQADLAEIANMTNKDITKMIAHQHIGIGGAFFSSGVESDMMNSDINTLYIGQTGLGLPDRDYYINNDAQTKKIRAEYIKYLEKIFTLSGYKATKAKSAAKNVLSIETELAKSSMSREEMRDIAKQYNPRTVAELIASYPNIDWKLYFEGIKLPNVETIILMQPNALATVNELVVKLKEQAVKDYFAFSYISSASSYLSDEFVTANFDLYGKTLQGTKEMQPRWKRALGVPNGLLGEAVGELYVNKYFAHGSKERMMKLVNNLKISLGEHIANLPWMSNETKINALVKLNSFTVKIGYPDKWRDYSGININPTESYWANVKKAILFEAARHFAKYGTRVDKDEWGMTPQTVNAYYNPTTNEICFPAGILQPPFFDVNADDASNYGAIGVVIGHEMTHGFDDQGRNFDQNGNMKDWWTDADTKNFKGLTDILVSQFDNIKVLGEEHANGRFTLGENIADQGGLRVAYTAFKKTQQGQSEDKIDGFTPDQRFYLGYAGVWAGNIRDEEILRRTKTDPHSLGRWRVNATLKNIEPFYKAFNINEGDKMFLAPADRVIIW
ncbi:MAG: M13 family metallopeptidase [Muribaculaceae bacterium]|nr:M13 family metallopeptidase [Muribaculaceae bacterium]